jgi:very-short-patch-repair endonuclease
MEYLTSSRPSGVWAIARRQHGVVEHGQLIALGFHPQAIKRRIANGRLHPLYRGVYAVGRPEITREGQWMAAVLACGPGAALSHRSAAAHLGILGDRSRLIHISFIAPGDRRSRRGIRVYRRGKALTEKDLTLHNGIPVTSIVATLVDLATFLNDTQLERAVNKADALDLIDPERLRAAIEGVTRPGAARLRKLLDRHTFAVTESVLEQHFLPLAAKAGLPPPETQRHFPPHRVDFYWPDPDLVVECDSLRHHRTALQQTTDVERDHAHFCARRQRLRFTHHQVVRQKGHVLAVLRVAASGRSGFRASRGGSSRRTRRSAPP